MSKNVIEKLHHAFNDYLITTFGINSTRAQACEFTLNVDEARQQFGDISSNAAMLLAKELKRAPRDLAQEIAQNFSHPYIQKIEPAGPGFLNIFLSVEALRTLTKELAEQGIEFFKTIPAKPQHINVEFVSANPTGPLHFGHGRGGIIGDVLSNVLRFLGNQVTAEFYINDAGSQIDKLGNAFKIRCMQVAGQDVQLPEDAYHGEYLVELAKECIKTHGAQVLEKPDAFFAEYAKTHLLERIKYTLNKFGITFDNYFSEKTLHEQGLITEALEIVKKNGYLYEQDGALWLQSTAFGDDKDRVVRKASGELTYVAADIAYLKNKIDRGANRLIMTLGHDHHSYVVRLHAVQQALGLGQYPLDIILYQLVKINEGGEQVRMSKRAGKMVTLDDVIDAVGSDVARFFFLNRKADAQLDFDLNLALTKSEENPVYYLQYAYVRTKSILGKAAELTDLETIGPKDSQYIGQEESLLIKKMVSLKTLLVDIGQQYNTHTLTYFALELANLFHKYYSQHRVIDPDNINKSRARLLLVKEIRNTFELILDLLELSKPDRM
ncbi:MAG TPA: arginine--tRNA ligase [Candidatus Dependentiae bacterium]|nr:arginine--tRNA ligase [Candidatus Dependentiae bacterium]HRQ62572.1 arginine--tRNA ligase [Candidatus Dependentiae bacterium]